MKPKIFTNERWNKKYVEKVQDFSKLLLSVKESRGYKDCIFMKFMSIKDRKRKKGIGRKYVS